MKNAGWCCESRSVFGGGCNGKDLVLEGGCQCEAIRVAYPHRSVVATGDGDGLALHLAYRLRVRRPDVAGGLFTRPSPRSTWSYLRSGLASAPGKNTLTGPCAAGGTGLAGSGLASTAPQLDHVLAFVLR